MSPEEIQKCEDREIFKSKDGILIDTHTTPLQLTYVVQANSILRNVATKLDYDNEQLESLHERTAWALEDKTGIPSSSYSLFKKAVT